MSDKLQKTKLIAEVAAFGFGALFILLKLLGGQFNAGMQVALELDRARDIEDPARDLLVVTARLARNDIGRIQIQDVLLEISFPGQPHLPPRLYRFPRPERERNVLDGKLRLTVGCSGNGTHLPPGDGTQLAYVVYVPPSAAVHADVTILATRTLWVGNPQWRASAVSLPTPRREGEVQPRKLNEVPSDPREDMKSDCPDR